VQERTQIFGSFLRRWPQLRTNQFGFEPAGQTDCPGRGDSTLRGRRRGHLSAHWEAKQG